MKLFFSIIILLLPFLSISQRQMNVRALDITKQTNLHDFTLMVIHEKDTTEMMVSSEIPPLTILPGSCEIIIQKAGYQVASTDRWDCPDDSAAVLIEFRLLKEDATRQEVRRGRRNSRKMGIDSFNANAGGFEPMRAGTGRHFTSIVYIVTKESFATHYVAE